MGASFQLFPPREEQILAFPPSWDAAEGEGNTETAQRLQLLQEIPRTSQGHPKGFPRTSQGLPKDTPRTSQGQPRVFQE